MYNDMYSDLKDGKEKAAEAASDAHRSMLRLNILLAGAIVLAMFMGAMCRRANAAERVDIVGDIGFEHVLITPAAIRMAGAELDVYIDTNGGLLDGARAIGAALDARRAAGYTTRCYATKAISAGFIIFAACDLRLAAPYGRFMMHYPYIVSPRITVEDVDGIRTRLFDMKKDMDKWTDDVFKQQGGLMRQYMVEEKMMSGRELCRTFLAFCHVSYIFPILED